MQQRFGRPSLRLIFLRGLLLFAMLLVSFVPTNSAAAQELPPRPPVIVPTPPPPPPPPVDEAAPPIVGPAARVIPIIRASPNLTVAAGEIFTIEVELTNRGQGRAQSVQVAVAYNSEMIEILDSAPGIPEFYVSEVDEISGIVTITAPPMARNAQVRNVLTMRVRSNAAIGSDLLGPASVGWNDSDGRREGLSNRPFVIVASESFNDEILSIPLFNSEAGFLFGADIYAPFEPVGVWYNTPSGEAIGLGTFLADANGVIDLELIIGDDPPGSYSVVLRGLWLQQTLVGYYELLP